MTPTHEQMARVREGEYQRHPLRCWLASILVGWACRISTVTVGSLCIDVAIDMGWEKVRQPTT